MAMVVRLFNGDGGAALHQSLQGLLHQTLALGVEGRGGLVEDEDGRVLEDGTGDADALALTAGEATTTVANHGVVAVLALHDEVVGIGYLSGLDDLFHRGVIYAEGDVVVEGVIEEDGLLVDVADEGTQFGDAYTLDVLAVDEYFTLLHIVVARHQVHEGTLAGAGLSHEGDGLALWHDEVDVLEHGTPFDVTEADVAQLHLLLEGWQRLRVLGLTDGVLGLENEIDTVHGGEAEGNLIGGLRELLQRVDDAVEDDHVEDEGGGIDEVALAEDEETAEPQHDDDDDGSQELRHGMGGVLADDHRIHATAKLIVDEGEALQHLRLGDEGFDDAQAAQRLVQLRDDVTPLALHGRGLALQLAADDTHDPACHGSYDDDEDRQLPAGGEEGEEADEDGDGLPDKHVNGAGDGALNALNVSGHTGDDISFSLFGEETQRQLQHLLINLHADVAYDARAQGHHDGGGTEVPQRLESRHDNQCNAHEHQREECSVVGHHLLNPRIGVVDDDVLLEFKRLVGIYGLVYLEQNVEDRDEDHEREHVHPL